MSIRFVPLIAASALLAGCTTPYSQLYGTRYYKAAIDTYPVTVISVDGEHYLRQPVRIDPGTHQVTVQAPPTVAQSHGKQRTMTLDVEPCMRYYLVAVKPNPLSTDFEVKVEHKEPVPGCSRTG
jgi:hypothetical protein